MTDREKLVELIRNVYVNIPPQIYRAVVDDTAAAVIADHLLANGVVVPPCKVGDVVFAIKDGAIFSGEVRYVIWNHNKNHGLHREIALNPNPYFSIGASFEDFGKTVFLTREEAEAALKEGK